MLRLSARNLEYEQVCTRSVSDESQLLFDLNCLRRSTARKRFRRDIFDAWDNCCAYCGTPNPSTLDHVIPRCRGGLTVRNNLVAACMSCNLLKSDSDFFVWLRSQYFWCETRELNILRWVNENPYKTEAARFYEELRRIPLVDSAA